MISAEEIKALMAKDGSSASFESKLVDFLTPRLQQYSGMSEPKARSVCILLADDMLTAGLVSPPIISTLQTLLNQAAEDIREARELCDLILGYPPETQIKGAIESKAFDLAHGTIVTLAAITPYLTKEGE